jgi:hypothetical protein
VIGDHFYTNGGIQLTPLCLTNRSHTTDARIEEEENSMQNLDEYKMKTRDFCENDASTEQLATNDDEYEHFCDSSQEKDEKAIGTAAASKKRGCFPKNATNKLKHWLFQNLTVCWGLAFVCILTHEFNAFV